MLRVASLNVSLLLTVSSEESRSTLVYVSVYYVSSCESEYWGSLVAFCASVLLSGVSHEINSVIYFGQTRFGVIQTLRDLIILDLLSSIALDLLK